MLVGRFGVIVPVLAIAGGLAAKRSIPPGPGSFPTTGPLWVGLLVGIILIVGGLTFLPALALGPIADQAQVAAGLVQCEIVGLGKQLLMTCGALTTFSISNDVAK